MLKIALCKSLLPVLVYTVIVSGCGGGGSSSSRSDGSGTEPTTPITTTPTTQQIDGRITGFGSVIVNGVHFDVDTAAIMHDGVPITEADLKVGMIIRLAGSIEDDGLNGIATEIEFDEEVKGPVASVDVASSSFIVLGQTVFVDEETRFDGSSLETLGAGNVVEVSGYFDAAGALRASLVELKSESLAAGEEVEVKGVIQALDTASQTFMLRDLTVSYSGARLSDVPDSGLANGMFVEVKANVAMIGGILMVQEIEFEDDDADTEEGQELELEGLVTGITSATEFMVNGNRVILTNTTEFEDGSAADIALNVKIKVEGEVNADGALVADGVTLRRRGNLRLEATVDSVDPVTGSITLLGVAVSTTATTAWEDDSETDEHYFSLDHIKTGDWVEVRGYLDANGMMVATAVERDDADGETVYSVHGPLSNLANAPDFSVLGIAITTDLLTGFELVGETSSELFFAGVIEGDIVAVKGHVTGTAQIDAISVELEHDDGRDEFGGDQLDHDDDDASDGAR